MGERKAAAPRCAALVGPDLSGKTTLLEALLHATEATARRGSVKEGTTVGDSAAEARAVVTEASQLRAQASSTSDWQEQGLSQKLRQRADLLEAR